MGVAVTIFTVGEIISIPVSGAYISQLAPEKMRGRNNGVIGLTWHFGHTVATGFGILHYQTHAPLLWWGSLACGIVSLVILMIVKPPAMAPH